MNIVRAEDTVHAMFRYQDCRRPVPNRLVHGIVFNLSDGDECTGVFTGPGHDQDISAALWRKADVPDWPDDPGVE
jgi:hypothetical protein